MCFSSSFPYVIHLTLAWGLSWFTLHQQPAQKKKKNWKKEMNMLELKL